LSGIVENNIKIKEKKVYVTGTRDRLFVVFGYNNDWLLVDRRGNYYERADTIAEIEKHIDEFIEKGTYTTKYLRRFDDHLKKD